MFGLHGFKGGIHPSYGKKATEHLPTEILPPPPKVIIPLLQHVGAPANAIVKKGDRVRAGQPIGEPDGPVSAAVHSSISGTVVSVGSFPHQSGLGVHAVEIETDGHDEKADMSPPGKSWHDAAPGELVKIIESAGIVGMGGEGFPTHVKLSPPSNRQIDVLIVNGAESEPLLAADHRVLVEKTEQVIEGALIVKKILGAQKAFIAVEDHARDAIATIGQKIADSKFDQLSLVVLKSKYPQGAEKLLIRSITKRTIPSGGTPADIGCVVQNTSTVYAIWNAICKGIPLYERVVTVAGPAVREPKNLLVRIGTPLSFVLDYCNTDVAAAAKVVLGGLMKGIAVSLFDIAVMKSTTGIMALKGLTPGNRERDCIGCGACHRVCPISLVPSMIAKYVEKGNVDRAEAWGNLECIECGCCSFKCPAKINLVHFMVLGKDFIKRKKTVAQNKK